MNRVDPKDAIFYLGAKSGRSSDHCLVYGFVDGRTTRPPVHTTVVADLTRALSRVERIRRRLVEVPATLAYPRWEAHSTPASTFVTAHQPDGRWTETLRRLAELVEDPIDTTQSAWRADLVDVVTDAPFSDRPVIVVVLRVSHTFVDGQGAAALGRSVFGEDAEVAGPPPAVGSRPGSEYRAALHGAVTLPAGIAGYIRALVTDARRGRNGPDTPPAPPQRPLSPLNAPPGADRSVAIIVRPRPPNRLAGMTVTTIGLTAVSLALQRYLATGEQTDLSAGVPVGVPDSVEFSGANRVVTGTVDLHTDVPDLVARAELIQHDLHAERARVLDPAVLQRLGVLEAAPAPLLVAITALGRRVTPTTVAAHTVVTSINRGDAPLRLGDATAVLSSGFPALTRHFAMKHGIYTLGRTVTIGVVWSPTAVPDGHRQPALLQQAWDEVIAALTDEGTPDA
ncbi:wax ester/triacylglycerol synthase family O-acyltransferase [Williamsia maris]|uniref:Wax ester synthase-like Acyl-CoA acyltransferase domain-containing protein n=1 Tax=Williamsia maris TaxID=72806 RepID=A0ABT1HGD4_9NOCA|nr:wax ester/triacylglycerol synthase family O-acyltransferase [Williamsia maris]MCP2175966.1 Wax ester synthase-like Acyl-CoA acyltransferase domain-containing protein [Williamsia maris]